MSAFFLFFFVLLLSFVCFCFCYLSWVLFVFFFLFFLFLFFLFSLAMQCGLWALSSLARAWASRVGAPNPGCWTAREFLGPGNINWCVLSQRYPSRHQDLAPPNCLQAPVLDTSCRTTSKTGTQPHPSADMLPKAILSSQTPQNTPPDTALPNPREKTQLHPPEHRHQSLPPGSPHKPLDQPHPPGTDNGSKRNYDPAAHGKETINAVN